MAIEDYKRKESSEQKRKNAKGRTSHDDLALDHLKTRSNKKTREQSKTSRRSTTEDLAAKDRRKGSKKKKKEGNKTSRHKPGSLKDKDRLKPKTISTDPPDGSSRPALRLPMDPPERSGRPALRRLNSHRSQDDLDIELQRRKKAPSKGRAKIKSDASI